MTPDQDLTRRVEQLEKHNEALTNSILRLHSAFDKLAATLPESVPASMATQQLEPGEDVIRARASLGL